MTKLFVSYAREDTAFVQGLDQALRARGFETWVDSKDIPPSADWRSEILAGIEAAQAILFVLSPDWLDSEVCGEELAHAVLHKKRLIPVVNRAIDSGRPPESLRKLNWVFATSSSELEAAIGKLASAIEADLDWLKAHTRLLTRAIEWNQRARDPSFALRGRDLAQSEQFLAVAGTGKEPQPTTLQVEYILESRRLAARRQRLALGAVLFGVTVVVVLTVLGLAQRRNARLYESREYHERGMAALADGDVLEAQLRFAEALTLDDRRETRERLIEARARGVRRTSTSPTAGTGAVVALTRDGARYVVLGRDGSMRVLRGDGFVVADALPGAHGPDSCAAFSADGRLVSIGDAGDDAVTVWDLAAGAPIAALRGHEGGVTAIAFARDGSSLVAGDAKGAVHVWNLSRGAESARLVGAKGRAWSLAFSPDGRWVAGGSMDNNAYVWAADGQSVPRVLVGHDDAVLSVAFHPDGTTLATGSWDNRIIVWDLGTMRAMRTLAGHTGGVVDLAFDAAGDVLASASEDGSVRLWDTAVGRNTLTLRGGSGHARRLAFRGNTREILAGGDDGAVRAWQADGRADGAEVLTLRGHGGSVTATAFSADARTLVSASRDQRVRVWSIAEARLERTLTGHEAPVTSVAVHPAGGVFASGSKDRTVRIWSASASASASVDAGTKSVLSHESAVRQVAFSGDGKLLASASDDGVRVWHVDADGATSGGALLGGAANALAFRADGRLLATGGRDRIVRLWSVGEDEPPREVGALRGHDGTVWDLAFSPDGKLLVSAAEDRTARVWDLAAHREVKALRGHDSPIWGVAFRPDGRSVATASQDSTIRLWSIERDEVLVLRGCEGPVWRVTFSADGRWLAASGQDRAVRVWEMGRIDALLTRRPEELLADAELRSGVRADAPRP